MSEVPLYRHSEAARSFFHTQYTARTDELMNPIAIQW